MNLYNLEKYLDANIASHLESAVEDPKNATYHMGVVKGLRLAKEGLANVKAVDSPIRAQLLGRFELSTSLSRSQVPARCVRLSRDLADTSYAENLTDVL